MRLERLFFVAALLVAPAAFAALATEWEMDFDENTKDWKEIQAMIPAYPKGDNLVLLETAAESSHRIFVDPASVSLGEDGVVRYTLVLKAAGGAMNVTFEGMRCKTREGKLYAVGRSDGTWVRARDPKWQRIIVRDRSPHHMVLYRDYFCPSPSQPTPPKVAIEALRRGVGLERTRTIDE